jgi:hypothetical protein
LSRDFSGALSEASASWLFNSAPDGLDDVEELLPEDVDDFGD